VPRALGRLELSKLTDPPTPWAYIRFAMSDSRALRQLIVEAAEAMHGADVLAESMARRRETVEPADLDAIASQLPSAVLHLDQLTARLGSEPPPPLLPPTIARAIRAARDSFGH
jgi:hypothetical protein